MIQQHLVVKTYSQNSNSNQLNVLWFYGCSQCNCSHNCATVAAI